MVASARRSADVYVRDKHQLGLKEWFEAKNPTALAQTIERMIEAARQGYWQADPKVLAELKERYRDLAQRRPRGARAASGALPATPARTSYPRRPP